MDELDIEDISKIDIRNKYENRIIKKHFLNCGKNNKSKMPRKSSTNSKKLGAYRKSHRSDCCFHKNPKWNIQRCKQNQEISKYLDSGNSLNNNKLISMLSNFGENVLNVQDVQDVQNINNMNGWQCEMCTFLNVESTLYCEMCNKCNPLCLSLSNITIEEHIDIADHHVIKDVWNYDEDEFEDDDFDDKIQYILLSSVGNDDNDNEESKIDSNFNCLSQNDDFNSYVIVEEEKKDDVACVFNHDEDNYMENVCRKYKKHNKTSSFKEYWQTLKQYNKKSNDNFLKITKNSKKKSDSLVINKKRAFYKILEKYPSLKRDLVNIESLTDMFKSYFCGAEFKTKWIFREEWLQKFYHGHSNQYITTVFHGTDKRNNRSILKRGLIVGGTKGIARAHGCSYGQGIYCSPLLATASNYARGSIYVCLTYNYQQHGMIWVAPDESHILPCFLISYYHISQNTDVKKFFPVFKPLNVKNVHRKLQRKWFAKNNN